jgi:hypothetical protein
MPFIEPSRRKLIDQGKLDPSTYTPGDRAYLHYRDMLRKWRQAPRWATVDALYRSALGYITLEDAAAAHLAFHVFFQLHVMPYERKKRRENGEVE